MACAPPTTDIYLHQSAELLFVEWSGFPRTFKKRAYARMEETTYGLIPKYDLLLWEDAATREVVVENMYGNEIARLAPEPGFDPLGWAKAGLGVASALELTDFQRTIHDSSHTALALSLTPVEFAVAYGVDLVEEPAMMVMSSIPIPPSGTNTTSGGGGGLSNQAATVTFPLPAGFSGLGELFVRGGLESHSPGWAALDSHLAITNAAEFSWTDPASTNLQRRFYILGDMRLDDDGDGYSSLREALIEGTDPAAHDHVDTDGDGLHDWHEFLLFANLSQTASGDFDGDGLANGAEMVTTPSNVVYHSSPANADTDGDGVGDADDPAPNDPDVTTTNTVRFELDFDAYGDGFTEFSLAVTGEGVNYSETFGHGEGDDLALDLVKGQSYTIAIENTHQADAADASYSALVSGSGFVIDDPTGALGDHSGDDCDGCAASATIHVPKIVTETVAIEPTDRSRKTVGVGEEVKLTYLPAGLSPITWTVSGNGSVVVNPVDNSVKYVAGDAATNTVISAAYKGQLTEVSFDVVAPDGIMFENWYLFATSVPADSPYLFSVSYGASVYVQPDTVNFQNIQLYESAAVSQKTGYYVGKSIPNHTANGPHDVLGYVKGKGSSMHAYDLIAMSADGAPYSNGTWSCAIDWSYTLSGGTSYFIETVNQVAELEVHTNKTVFSVTKDLSGAYIDTLEKEGRWIGE